jgi:ABC-2 type transport system ATP-binding protein
MAAVEAVTATGLVKRFEATTAVDDLDLVVQAGQVHGLLGANGAGKTTLLRLLFGLIAPDAGSIALLGRALGGPGSAALDHVAGFVEEPSFYPYLSGRVNLALLAKLDGDVPAGLIDDVLARVGLAAGGARRVGAYSTGMRQRLGIAAALLRAPRLLLLDEPTSGLDPLMEMAFRECAREARERGQTLFLSSHILSEVEAICDRVAILREGRLVDQGTLEQLRHLSARTVDVTFEGPAPELPALPGVQVERVGPSALRLEVAGGVGPVITAIAQHPVMSLTSREPSLEEIFLHHYDGSRG